MDNTTRKNTQRHSIKLKKYHRSKKAKTNSTISLTECPHGCIMNKKKNPLNLQGQNAQEAKIKIEQISFQRPEKIKRLKTSCNQLKHHLDSKIVTLKQMKYNIRQKYSEIQSLKFTKEQNEKNQKSQMSKQKHNKGQTTQKKRRKTYSGNKIWKRTFIKFEHPIKLKSKLSETLDKYQQYEHNLRKKDEQIQLSKFKINELQQKNHELSKRYQQIKYQNSNNAQLFKIQADQKIGALEQYIEALEVENKSLIRQQQEIVVQSDMYNPYRLKSSPRYDSPVKQYSLSESRQNQSIQRQDLNRQKRSLIQCLSQLIQFCKNNKQENNYIDTMIDTLQFVINTTTMIQEISASIQSIVEIYDELRSNQRLKQFFEMIQQNLAKMDQKCNKAKKMTFISCKMYVLEKLQEVCNRVDVLSMPQMFVRQHNNLPPTSLQDGQICQHQNQY